MRAIHIVGMKKIQILILLVTAIVLNGCSPSKPQSIAEYRMLGDSWEFKPASNETYTGPVAQE